MKIVIHAGMHKTGTSSIQEAFSRVRDDAFHYVNWFSPNHSAMFVLLFHDPEKLPDYHGFKAHGPAYLEKLPEMRAHWLERLSKDLDGANGKTVLFSAEAISASEFDLATERMRDFFRQWTTDIKVIGYLRPPRSFAQSAFQEYLKGGTAGSIRPGRIWPNYQARFSRLDRVFGKENVELRLFRRADLKDGDIVSDFGSLIGFQPSLRIKTEENVSLSLEATALLYAQRTLGKGYVAGFQGAPQCNARFIAMLSKVGKRPLVFGPDFWNPVRETFSADIAWAESRLGRSLKEEYKESEQGISDEKDLLDIARDSLPDLMEIMVETLKNGESGTSKVLAMLEFLRAMAYSGKG